jgi:wyosine [tRNA(Phe)-imidazoG37] synthetase (radical SAM superfamily)
MAQQYKYLYGPVPSRRLGRSLGIDIVPPKICTLDCVYCQIGRTTQKTLERAEYVPVGEVVREVKSRLTEGLEADYLTIGGSGEPTLNSGLGRLIDQIKGLTDIPVAVLTNGSLLYQEEVREACAKADVVLPSLDAPDDETFAKVNRPHEGLDFDRFVEGLVEFSRQYEGRIWLEVFFIGGVNTESRHVEGFAGLIRRIRPDKVHLNTAVRPTADAEVHKVAAEKLARIAEQLGPICEVIADFPQETEIPGGSTTGDAILAMLRRRPCSQQDICRALTIAPNLAVKLLTELENEGQVGRTRQGGTVFFFAR